MKIKTSVYILITIFIPNIFLSCSRQELPLNLEIKQRGVIVSKISKEMEEELRESYKMNVTQNCEDHIKKVTCYSEQFDEGFDKYCSQGKVSSLMLTNLQSLIKDLPHHHRNVYCNLSRIQIHHKMKTLGYASTLLGEESLSIGTMFGVRLDYLVGNINTQIETWKEQLNFNLSKQNDPFYNISDKGPKIVLDSSFHKEIFLLDLVVHELSHLIDYINNANIINIKYDPVKDLYNAEAGKNSFSLLSWPSSYWFNIFKDDPREGHRPPKEFSSRYPLLTKKCYYRCTVTIDPSLIDEVYRELRNSNFVSSYAAKNEAEDFAESSSYILLQEKGLIYQIKNAQDIVVFDLKSQLQKSHMQEKIRWIKDFYLRRDLQYKYPGQI